MKTLARRLARRTLLPAVVLAVAVAPLAAPAQQNSNQVALITLSSYDEIKTDIGFLGRLSGQPTLADTTEMMLGFLTGGQGLAGLDKAKPIGVAVYADGGEISVKALIPVTDMDALIGLLGNWGVVAEDGEDGVKELSAPGQTLYAKESNGWAVISVSPEAAKSGAENPEELIGTLSGTYDLAARVFVQNIPTEYRDLAIEQLRAGMEQGMVQDADESDEQFEMRKAMAQAQIEQFSQLLEDADELTFGWSIDGKEERTFIDFEMKAADGSKLANQMAEYKNLTTDYAGFYQPDAAATMTFAGKMAEEDIANMSQMFDGLRAQVMQQIEEEAELPDDESREVVKSAVNDFMDALLATLQEGKVDGGAVLNMSPDSMTFVAGGLVGDPSKIESGLKKLEALAEKDEEFPGISWNADSHGEIKFHTIDVPVPDEQAQQLVGDTMEIAVGTGGKSVFFALGRDAVASTKAIIDASKANAGKQVAPFELTASLGQILGTVAEVAPNPVVTRVAEMLESEAEGRDHIKIVEHVVDNGVKIRIELEEGVLRAIGTAVEESQKAAQGLGGF
jgi:hypothetical protein